MRQRQIYLILFIIFFNLSPKVLAISVNNLAPPEQQVTNNFSSRYLARANCVEMARFFFRASVQTAQDQGMDLFLMSIRSEPEKKFLRSLLRQLNEHELSLLIDHFDPTLLGSGEELIRRSEILRSYVYFIRQIVPESKRMEAWPLINEAIVRAESGNYSWIRLPSWTQESLLSRFAKYFHEIDQYEKSVEEDWRQKGLFSQGLRTMDDLRQARREHERLLYTCRSRTGRAQLEKENLDEFDRVLRAKIDSSRTKVKWVMALVAAPTSAATFGIVHYKDYEQQGKKWWMEMAYYSLFSVVLNFVNGAIGEQLKKWVPIETFQRYAVPLLLGLPAATDGAVTAGYTKFHNALWGTREDDIFKRARDFKEKHKELGAQFNSYLQDHPEYKKIWANMLVLKSKQTGETLPLDTPVPVNEIDWEESQSMLMAAISKTLYEQQRGWAILPPMGSPGTDRWVWDRMHDLVTIYPFLYTFSLMYQTMCGTDDRVVGFWRAMGLFTAYRISSDSLYFLGRKYMVGQ
ncbi:MAG: hypothetical protein WCG27_03165 [Pseudomonadota bacterium]